MNKIHLVGIDLNLLTVFDAVMRERNVTRAAGRLGLTQSAISHALGRLRLLFADPLFVRSPKGMTPTARATALAEPVRSLLAQAEALLAGDGDFDPAGSTRRFVIGMSDYASFVFLPTLLKLVRREAPRVTLIVKNTSHGEGLAMLDDEAVEMLVGNFPKPPPRLRGRLLFREEFACAARSGHPELRGGPTLKRYLQCEHLQVSTRGEAHGIVDHALGKQGRRRSVKVVIGHFLAAPFLVAKTDLVATEPRQLLLPLAKRLGLALFAPPFALPPFAVTQVWHTRHDQDPAQAWLRETVLRVAKGLEKKELVCGASIGGYARPAAPARGAG